MELAERLGMQIPLGFVLVGAAACAPMGRAVERTHSMQHVVPGAQPELQRKRDVARLERQRERTVIS